MYTGEVNKAMITVVLFDVKLKLHLTQNVLYFSTARMMMFVRVLVGGWVGEREMRGAGGSLRDFVRWEVGLEFRICCGVSIKRRRRILTGSIYVGSSL